MTKSSTVNVPDSPTAATGSSATGNCVVHADTLVVQTDERVELIDVTERIGAIVARSGSGKAW